MTDAELRATRLTTAHGWKRAWERAAYRRAKWGLAFNEAPLGSPLFYRAAVRNQLWANVCAAILREVA